MRKALLVAAGLGFSVSGAFACDFHQSAKAEQTTVDPAVVASISVPQSAADATPVQTQGVPAAQPTGEVPAK